MMRLLLSGSILILLGCASAPEPQPAFFVNEVSVEENDSIDESLVWAQQRAVDRVQAQITEKPTTTPSSAHEPVGAKEVQHEYKLDTHNDHPKVQKWIKYYSKKDRERFQRFLNRGARYKQVIQDLLVTNGLPPDLYYLGILESGYVIKARSRVGATGPWQFMAPTGREYGLKINNYVDERHDPIRSTLAAIRYLKELYRQKRSWHLALAAYNAGPGRVRRAMRRGGRVKNYWSLTRRRLLPYDTREYIPQFLAILTIGQDLQKYGFEEKPKEYLAPMELVKVPAPVRLNKISEISGVSLSELKKLNPHLSKNMTPPGKKKHYHLWVPKQNINQVAASFSEMKQHRLKGLKAKRRVASYRRRTRYHRVRRGQNLSTIARRYGTSVSKIKRLNGLKRSRIFVGQRLKVRGRAFTKVSKKKVARYHRVRRGDNLIKIARRYGVSVANLKRINGLKSGKIFKGQRLKLIGSKKVLRTASRKKVKRYKIRRGDNLYKIAKKFGLSIRRLKKINNLRSNRIQRGQYLKIAAN